MIIHNVIRKALLNSLLIDINRTLNLIDFSFNKDGKQFELHIQCFVKIIKDNLIIISSRELYEPFNKKEKNFDYSEDFNSVFDIVIKNNIEFLKQKVIDIKFINLIDFIIYLENGYAIQIISDIVNAYEMWRFFEFLDLENNPELEKFSKHYVAKTTKKGKMVLTIN